MRNWGAIILIAISVLLAALSALAAGISIFREGIGANAAAWAQAVGSIAAIAGAVWLFRSDISRRQHEQRAAGEQLAWAVRYAIHQAQIEAGIIAAEVLTIDIRKDKKRIRDWLLRTENCRGVLAVYVEHLNHIHPAINFHANNAILLLCQLEDEIKNISSSKHRTRPSVELSKRISEFPGFFSQLREDLDARMRGVLNEMDENPNFLRTKLVSDWYRKQK